jgi:hypothetical protein
MLTPINATHPKNVTADFLRIILTSKTRQMIYVRITCASRRHIQELRRNISTSTAMEASDGD